MKANDTQVGGTHYKTSEGVPQHWDLAVTYQWDPFQYQITKYVMRWKTKHPTPEKKLDDLKKARHFLDKYIEEYEKYLPKPTSELSADKAELEQAIRLSAYEVANPRFTSDAKFLSEGGWGDGTNLYTCLKCGVNITSTGLDGAHKTHPICVPAPPLPLPAK